MTQAARQRYLLLFGASVILYLVTGWGIAAMLMLAVAAGPLLVMVWR